MLIDLNKTKTLIEEPYPDIEFESNYEDDDLILTSEIEISDLFDDSIYIKIFITNDGFVVINFTFDEIEETIESYNLINSLNRDTILKGYVTKRNDINFFELEAINDELLSEEKIVDFVTMNIEKLFDEDFLEYLLPITELTY